MLLNTWSREDTAGQESSHRKLLCPAVSTNFEQIQIRSAVRTTLRDAESARNDGQGMRRDHLDRE